MKLSGSFQNTWEAVLTRTQKSVQAVVKATEALTLGSEG